MNDAIVFINARLCVLIITEIFSFLLCLGHITPKSEFPRMAGFSYFYFNDCTSFSELLTFDTDTQCYQTILI
jgi:hypothetical protein